MAEPNKRKILDELSDFMRLHHYSIHTERTNCDWVKRFIQFHRMTKREDLHGEQEKKKDVSTTMIYTHVLAQGGHGVKSPLDDLG